MKLLEVHYFENICSANGSTYFMSGGIKRIIKMRRLSKVIILEMSCLYQELNLGKNSWTKLLYDPGRGPTV